MQINPLFINNISTQNNNIEGKGFNLQNCSYLFSDIIKVHLYKNNELEQAALAVVNSKLFSDGNVSVSGLLSSELVSPVENEQRESKNGTSEENLLPIIKSSILIESESILVSAGKNILPLSQDVKSPSLQTYPTGSEINDNNESSITESIIEILTRTLNDTDLVNHSTQNLTENTKSHLDGKLVESITTLINHFASNNNTSSPLQSLEIVTNHSKINLLNLPPTENLRATIIGLLASSENITLYAADSERIVKVEFESINQNGGIGNNKSEMLGKAIPSSIAPEMLKAELKKVIEQVIPDAKSQADFQIKKQSPQLAVPKSISEINKTVQPYSENAKNNYQEYNLKAIENNSANVIKSEIPVFTFNENVEIKSKAQKDITPLTTTSLKDVMGEIKSQTGTKKNQHNTDINKELVATKVATGELSNAKVNAQNNKTDYKEAVGVKFVSQEQPNILNSKSVADVSMENLKILVNQSFTKNENVSILIDKKNMEGKAVPGSQNNIKDVVKNDSTPFSELIDNGGAKDSKTYLVRVTEQLKSTIEKLISKLDTGISPSEIVSVSNVKNGIAANQNRTTNIFSTTFEKLESNPKTEPIKTTQDFPEALKLELTGIKETLRLFTNKNIETSTSNQLQGKVADTMVSKPTGTNIEGQTEGNNDIEIKGESAKPMAAKPGQDSVDDSDELNKSIIQNKTSQLASESVLGDSKKPLPLIVKPNEADVQKNVYSGKTIQSNAVNSMGNAESNEAQNEGDSASPEKEKLVKTENANTLHTTQAKEFLKELEKPITQTSGLSEQIKKVRPSEVVKEIYKIIEAGDKHTVTLKLTPENLGAIKVVLETIKSNVIAKIEVENETIKQMVQANSEQLKQALTENGIQLMSLNVSLSNSESKTSKQQSHKKKSGLTEQSKKVETENAPTAAKKYGYNTYEYLA